jgi:hypothetical protein
VPSSWVALVIALLAVVPGFVASTLWARARTWRGPTGDLRTILQSLVLSAIIQVLLFPLTVAWMLPYRDTLVTDHPWRSAIWLALAVLILPAVLGIGAARATDYLLPVTAPPTSQRVRRTVRWLVKPSAPPSAWDWLFRDKPPNGKFVLLKFKDGSYIGGAYEENSGAATSPEPHGLILGVEWVVNDVGDFIEPIPSSHGVLIPLTDEIRWVRILDPGSQESMGSTDSNQTDNLKRRRTRFALALLAIVLVRNWGRRRRFGSMRL